MRFTDGPFVNRIERWPALVHAHLCGLMTILRLQAANGRTRWVVRCSKTLRLLKLEACPCTTVAIVFKLEGNVIGDWFEEIRTSGREIWNLAISL